ncbi:hypothetical protein Syun_004306 [Stephania yunnanensis]|uniref:Uncharacterized protein n=1 Tax=Stephania yunnanensis TaxID=152371 RepID=A0AAP0Q2E8_9MAGN
MSSTMAVQQVSSCIIKPEKNVSEESQQLFYLTPWDLMTLSANYIQRGLLFTKPIPLKDGSHSMKNIIDQLKDSLSSALTIFYPLTGHLVTKKGDDAPSYHVILDCTDAPGAQFAHAVADAQVADIIAPDDVPTIVESFFPFVGTVNNDGHTLPLLAVQVTELVDGIFVGCSINHVVADGNSFWHFFNTWSEISRTTFRNNSNSEFVPRPPIVKRWFLNGQGPIINLPFTHHDEFIERYLPSPHREKFFHFSPESVACLKEKANAECNTSKISSFQALAAVVWRSITRARQLANEQITHCWLPVDNRLRLDPPLTADYFGNCIQALNATTTAGELLSNNLGWSASLLHQAVAGHTDASIRAWLEAWVRTPFVYQYGQFVDHQSVMFGSSPRFDMYGNDFGWGRPLASRSGNGNKFDGKVTLYPGREGGGSIDLEVCLPHQPMKALELDPEFMIAASPSQAF